MRCNRWFVTIVLVALGAAVVVVMALALPALSQTASDQQITVSVHNDRSTFRFVDVGKKSYSVGDYDILRAPLLDPSSREVRGKFVIRCTWVAINFEERTHNSLCEGVAEFDEGRVTFYGGPVKFAGPGTVDTALAVTGGTGSYTLARGTVHALETQQGIDLTFELVTQ